MNIHQYDERCSQICLFVAFKASIHLLVNTDSSPNCRPHPFVDLTSIHSQNRVRSVYIAYYDLEPSPELLLL